MRPWSLISSSPFACLPSDKGHPFITTQRGIVSPPAASNAASVNAQKQGLETQRATSQSSIHVVQSFHSHTTVISLRMIDLRVLVAIRVCVCVLL